MESQTVTREALYDQVWAKPLTALAETYGVSSVALAKVCRKLNVPVPGRGYWAKVAAGHPVKKWPLPPTAKQQAATIRPPRPRILRPEDVIPQPATVAEVGGVEVPDRIEHAHSLTTKTRRHFADIQRRIARHAKRRPNAPYVSGDWPPHDDHGRFTCGGSDGFSLTVSFAVLDRALLILDVLAKALAKQGFRFEFAEPEDRNFAHQRLSGLLATNEGERLSLHLREGYTRRERTAKELAAAEKAHQYLPKYEHQPNGSLTLEVQGQEYGIKETFRDGKKENLELQLGRIVAAFVDAVPRQKRLRAEREQALQAQREAEHRRWVERERIREEEAHVEKLLSEAERARRFQVLRGYLNRLERTTLRDGAISDQGRKWLERARELVDAYDPAMERLGRSPSGSEEDID